MEAARRLVLVLTAGVVLASLFSGCSSDDGEAGSTGVPPIASTITPDGVVSVVGAAPFPAPDGEVVPWVIVHESCDSCRRDGELVVQDGRIDLDVDISDWQAGRVSVQISYTRTDATQHDRLTFVTDYQLDWRP